jgi:hypothetical protein
VAIRNEATTKIATVSAAVTSTTGVFIVAIAVPITAPCHAKIANDLEK